MTASWRRHQDLLRNASSLVATTGVTAAMGFAYWAFAARMFSQRAVGYGAAATSAMTVLGTIGMFGLDTLLIGELPRRRGTRVGLVSAALLASGIGSLVLGLGFAVVAPSASGRFGQITGTPGRAALFAVGVVLTGVTLVFDQATIGLMRGGLQLSRNVMFTAAKLMLLPVAAFALHDGFGVGITQSWVAGMAASLVAITIWLRFTGAPILPRPNWGVLRGLGRTVLAHNWLNLAIRVPSSLIPVLVTLVVSPSAGAAFYIAWTLSAFLYVVPAHLSTVLFAIASSDPQLIARKLRFTLRVSFLIGLPGMAILYLGAHMTLSMFGASYASTATLPLQLLIIAFLPTVPRVHYIAVCRASGRIARAAAVLTTFAALEVAAAVVGGASDGLKGVSLAIVAVLLVEGLVTTPAVLRAAVGHGRHRRADSKTASINSPQMASQPSERIDGHLQGQWGRQDWRCSASIGSRWSHGQIPTAQTDVSEFDRQEAGLAALLSLARSAAATSPIPIMPVASQRRFE
jgi:O-antigen/teichoic acid export membrane protein